MCLLELVVHWNLWPKASTEQTVDLPQVTTCPGPVSEPGGLISCGYFPRKLVGPVKAWAQALILPAISVPQGAVGRDLEGNMRAFDAADLSAFGEHPGDESGKSSDLAAENPGKNVRLALVGALVNEDAGSSPGLSGPKVALPSPDPDKAQMVEVDIAEVPLPDVPKQHRFAEAIIRSLGEGARAGDRTAAIVEPVSGDVPAGNLGHRGPSALRRFAASTTPSE
jgi:hypothetical protein